MEIIRDRYSVLVQNPQFKRTFDRYESWMLKKGYLTSRLFRGYDPAMILAVQDNQLVSFISSTFKVSTLEAHITGAWTHSKFRKQHLYENLWDLLVQLIKKTEYTVVASGYHQDNIASAIMQAKRGSRIVRVSPSTKMVNTEFYIV